MTRQRKIVLAKAAVLMGILPILLWAHEYGPDPGYVAVPGENGGATCATAGCHTGAANNPSNKGSVAVTFPNGNTYTPGVAQTLTVTVADPAERAAGFELTARVASSPSTMAGNFTATDGNTQLLCSQTNLQVFYMLLNTDPQTCRSGYTLQYIEQTKPGYLSSLANPLPYTFTFTWTPPTTNVGNVTIYVAGNAGPAGVATADNCHIYSTKYTLTPATGGTAPQISSGGIITTGDTGGFSAATEGSWIEIYGSNLGPAAGYQWQTSDFNGNTAPTKLQGVSVTINGQSAYLSYVSAGQVNAQIPSGVGTGPATVILQTSDGMSAPYTLTLNALEPGFFAPSSFTVSGKRYLLAINSDSTPTSLDFALPSTASLGVKSRPAKPSETLVLYGSGFGPAAANGKTISPGTIVANQNSLTNSFQIFFGGAQATVSYAGLAPGYIGLYQFNVVVPSTVANSDAVPVTFNVGGNTGGQTLYTAVHN